MNVTVPTTEQSDDLLFWDQIDLINLLTVDCSNDHCRERQRLLIYHMFLSLEEDADRLQVLTISGNLNHEQSILCSQGDPLSICR